MLLVPRSTRTVLLRALAQARRLTKYQDPLTLKGLRIKRDRYECTRLWIEMGVYSLIQNPKGRFPSLYHKKRIYCDEERRAATDFIRVKFTGPVKTKFIVFREASGLKSCDFQRYPDFGAKVETTFRIGLKGGLHFFV